MVGCQYGQHLGSVGSMHIRLKYLKPCQSPEKSSENQIPADSESLIYAMNDGKPMAPRLMYEFPRAAMNLENKKSLEFDLEIRHVEYQTGHKPQSLIGGSFLNLKGSQERFIERYVVELQRLLRSRNEQNS